HLARGVIRVDAPAQRPDYADYEEDDGRDGVAAEGDLAGEGRKGQLAVEEAHDEGVGEGDGGEEEQARGDVEEADAPPGPVELFHDEGVVFRGRDRLALVADGGHRRLPRVRLGRTPAIIAPGGRAPQQVSVVCRSRARSAAE